MSSPMWSHSSCPPGIHSWIGEGVGFRVLLGFSLCAWGMSLGFLPAHNSRQVLPRDAGALLACKETVEGFVLRVRMYHHDGSRPQTTILIVVCCISRIVVDTDPLVTGYVVK